MILITNILIPFLNQFWFQENFCCNHLQIQVPWIKNHNNALSLDLYFTFRFRMICLLKFEVLRVQSHSDSGWLDTTLILPPSPVNENLQDWKTKKAVLKHFLSILSNLQSQYQTSTSFHLIPKTQVEHKWEKFLKLKTYFKWKFLLHLLRWFLQ